MVRRDPLRQSLAVPDLVGGYPGGRGKGEGERGKGKGGRGGMGQPQTWPTTNTLRKTHRMITTTRDNE